MTEEHAKLLLKDLSSRLPYGVKLQISSWDDEKMEYVDKVDTLYSISSDNHVRTSSEDRDFYIDEVKPYLFPMSSMTDEQCEEFLEAGGWCGYIDEVREGDFFNRDENLGFSHIYGTIDWLNRNHIDYRGWIDKDRAVDATGLGIY